MQDALESVESSIRKPTEEGKGRRTRLLNRSRYSERMDSVNTESTMRLPQLTRLCTVNMTTFTVEMAIVMTEEYCLSSCRLDIGMHGLHRRQTK